MNRREVVQGTAALAGAALAPAGREATARRNVLLLIADDQGLDAGCYGVPVSTPRIDAFARQGTRFTSAYANVSSCSPSRAVLYTGLYAHQNGMYGLQHGIHHQSLFEGIETLPATLRRAGYATALVGKKHVGPAAAFPYEAELVPEREGIRDVRALAQAMGGFIRDSGNRPFFVTVGFSDPHRATAGFGNDPEWPGVRPVRYMPETVPVPRHLPDSPLVRSDLADYYRSVSRLDAGIGMMLDVLSASGRAGETLVFFLSDNGRPFPGAKTNLYEPGLHLPLIIRAPDAKAGVNRALVSWIDIAPTILAYAGVAPPAAYRLPGRSLLPLLGENDAHGRDAVFASHEFHEITQYYPMRAVRTRTHSYIINLAHELPYPVAGDIAASPSWHEIVETASLSLGRRSKTAYLRRPAEELYDLRSDPDEVENVANSRDHRSVLNSLRDMLRSTRIDTRDPWPT